jgi:hypothetical protein
MKTDVYTKTVLTVIALCLVWISVREIAWPKPVAAQTPTPSVVTVSGFTPNAIQQLTAFNPDGRGERGIPVIVMNEVKVKPVETPAQANAQRRCVWTHIVDSGEPNVGSDGNVDFSRGANWQQVSGTGWELKVVSENNYVFEKCEPQKR